MAATVTGASASSRKGVMGISPCLYQRVGWFDGRDDLYTLFLRLRPVPVKVRRDAEPGTGPFVPAGTAGYPRPNFPREDDRKGPWLEDNRLRTNTKSGQTAAKTKVAGKEDPAGQAFPTEVPRKPSTGVKSSSSSATSQKNSHSRQLPSLAATVPEV